VTIAADDLAIVRSWCGTAAGTSASTYTEADLTARMDRLADAHAVALEVLRQMRADLLADPASLTLTGDYAHDVAANLAGLDHNITQLERLVGDAAGTVSVSRLFRRSPRR
jgi:hypothetical protein